MKFETHIADFIQYIVKNRRMSLHTAEAYNADLDQFNAYLVSIGNPDLEQLKSNHVRIWMSDLIQNGLSARSVNRKLSSLRSFFKTKTGSSIMFLALS